MDNEQVLEKEIDLIQNCITRMSQNSFNVKGWLIALLVAVIALLPETIDIVALCFMIVGITLVFWFLDGFFLKIETLYRWKYNWVISKRLKTDDFFYNLNPHNKKCGYWIMVKSRRKNLVFSERCLPKLYGLSTCPLYLWH